MYDSGLLLRLHSRPCWSDALPLQVVLWDLVTSGERLHNRQRRRLRHALLVNAQQFENTSRVLYISQGMQHLVFAFLGTPVCWVSHCLVTNSVDALRSLGCLGPAPFMH